MHTIERFTRLDAAALKYELTVDDPGAYTKPWSGGTTLRWNPLSFLNLDGTFGYDRSTGVYTQQRDTGWRVTALRDTGSGVEAASVRTANPRPNPYPGLR